MLSVRVIAMGLALATTADAAVVICQKKNKLKLRVDACKSKETPVPASELAGGSLLAPWVNAGTSSVRRAPPPASR
jgi:hypothetical protein